MDPQFAHVPTPTRPLVRRDRLLRELRTRWDRRVTAIVAGAGFGKTSLLVQAVRENLLDPLGEDVWIACGRGDQVASVLAGRFQRALGVDVSPGDDPALLATAIAGAVAARSPVPVSLLVDDVHVLGPDDGGASLLAELLAALPANGHLVLASRVSPALPLARMTALGELARLGEDDLAFDDDELEAFAELRQGSLDRARDAGRWPAIVELSLSAGGSVVDEFLWEEVLAGLAPERRRRLAMLSTLGGADDVELGAALDRQVDVEELVADLPLASVTDGRAQLHALWDPVLAPHLPSEERHAGLRAVAALRTEAGDFAVAYELLRRADAWADIAELVVMACSPGYPLVGVDVLERWASELEERQPERPATDLLVGNVRFLRSPDPSASIPQLLRAWDGFAAAGSVAGEVASMASVYQGVYFVGDDHTMLRIAARLIELHAEGHPEAAGLAELAEGFYARYLGEYARALECFLTPPRETLSPDWNGLRDSAIAEAHASLGEPERGYQVLQQRPFDQPGILGDLRCEALTHIGFLAGRVETAWELSRSTLQVRALAPGRWQQGFEAAAARIGGFLGHVDEAARYLDAALAHGLPADWYMTGRVAIAEAAVAISRGDEAGAVCALERTEIGPGYAYDRNLALPYVLVPTCRAAFDEAPLGPAYLRTRELARAVVDLREGGGTDPVAALGPLDPTVVRPALPVPWAVLLVVGAEAVGRGDGRALLTALGPPARPWLGELAEHDDPKLRAAARRLLSEVPAAPEHAVRVRLLGPPELAFDDEVSDSAHWRRERVRELLAWLVVHPTTTREAAGDALWPDLDGDAVANNLRTHLSYLLQALQPDRRAKEASYFVDAGERTLALVGGDCLSVDVWAFDELADRAAAAETAGVPSAALEAYRSAAELWRGPLLADAPTAWADDEAERLRARFVHVAARGAELAAAAGDTVGSSALARRAIEADPWSERAFRALATAQLDAGEATGARQTLDRLGAVLDELGVEPEPATEMLRRRLTRR